MQGQLLVFTSLVLVALASPQCHTFTECRACTSSPSWLGKDCRWCPLTNDCHALGSEVNQCKTDQIIFKPDKCGELPKPLPPLRPARPTSNSSFAKGVLKLLFQKLHITNVDVDTCVADVGGAETSFKAFEYDIASKRYSTAMMDLSRGISALSNSVTDCQVTEVQQKLDALAAAIRWANISTKTFDHDVKILVGASELWDDLTKVAAAVKASDSTAVGQTLSVLLDDWTAITGGCKDGQHACHLIDGLLRVLAVTAENVVPCESAIEPAINDFVAASVAFSKRNFSIAVSQFALGLDVIAQATLSDACGLKAISSTIGDLSAKLAAAVVRLENSSAVKIIVGSADIYVDLYMLAESIQKGDFATVGLELGALLAKLRASGCQTKACIIIEGIIGSLQVGFTDLKACESDVDAVWVKLQDLVVNLKAKNWKLILSDLGNILEGFADSVKKCGVSSLASVLEDAASRLRDNPLANEIGAFTQILVSGADVTQDIGKLIVDAEQEQWTALGQDLGTLSAWISGEGCQSFVCRLVEGLLKQAETTLIDLKPCEADLRGAETEFTACAALWSKNRLPEAVEYCATGLRDLALGVKACGLEQQLGYIEQEANMLGLGNITVIDDIVKVLVHGSDAYDLIYEAVQDIQRHDYRDAGSALGNLMNGFMKWTTGHVCTEPACYVVMGVMQYLSDLENDMHSCEADFGQVWNNFSHAFEDLSGGNGTLRRDEHRLKDGIHAIGAGFFAISNIVGDCHLVMLSQVVALIAAKLGMNPVISGLEEALKILINGVQIEREIAAACEDWADSDWPGFGYNVIKLLKAFLAEDAARLQVNSKQVPASVYI